MLINKVAPAAVIKISGTIHRFCTVLIVFLFLYLLFPIFVGAQPPSIIKHYSTDDGLSHSGVMCMIEDHKGFMWFGTWDGLNKFDGYTFTNYKSRPGDSCFLSHNRIDYIKEDRFGFLWVRTYDDKIHRFDRRTETFRAIPHSIKKYSTLNIHVTNVYETRSGEMWLIAKDMGCFRVVTNPSDFSYKVTHYSSNFNDKFLLSNNNVNFIFEDSEKNLWIGTEAGLNCIEGKYKPSIDKALRSMAALNFKAVYEMAGSIWFGTSKGLLVRYDLKMHRFESYPVSGSPDIEVMAKLSSGALCLGSRNSGLYLYDCKSHTSVNFNRERFSELSDNRIRSIYIDRFGLVWLETNSSGVVRFNPATKSFKRFEQKIDKVSPYVYLGNFYNIYEDVNGLLWVSLRGGGFGYYNRQADKIEYLYNEPGSPGKLFSNLVTCTMSDSYGNLWLSTYTRGIEKVCFINNRFNFCTPSTDYLSLSANEVRSIFEDRQRNLWVGTREGKLYCYDKDRKLRKVFSNQTKGAGDICFNGMVYAIMQDREGGLWFGTKGDGIIRAFYNGDFKFRTEHYKNDPNDQYSLSNDLVYTIGQDSKGRIWIGTFGGGLNLMERVNGKIRFRNTNNSFTGYPQSMFNKIRHWQEDARGRIWLATTNGLVIFDPNTSSLENTRFYYYQKKPGDINSLSGNDVHYIFRDKQNNMWIGTFGGGLNKVISMPNGDQPPRFKAYNTVYDQPVDIVLSIQDDNKGNLWLATEAGLSMFNPKTEKFLNFSESDGLRKTSFSEAACFKNPKGELFFGSLDGYYVFNPDKVLVDRKAPHLALINLQLFNKNVEIGANGSPLKQALSETKAITLRYNQSVFSIEYAGLDFRNTDKLEYAFMLEGFEKEWNYVRKQRKATYTNLPPGNYVFKVKCTSNGIFTDGNMQQLQITILPPWWKTIWAYLSYLVVIAILLIISRKFTLEIIRLKNKVIIEQKLTDLKLLFFTNVSHELRTPLTLILGPVEELLKSEPLSKRGKEYLELIDKNGRRMLRHVNQLLDFRKIQTGKMRLKIAETEMVSFVREIYTGFKELAQSRNIQFKFSANVNRLTAWIDREKIDTVVFNLLSNAFKFTPEGKGIELFINKVDNASYFEVIIKDQGVGIAKEDIPLLFERFAISHSSADFRSKGTGIGLALVKEIVELHKGTVSVESIPGQGSTFKVRINLGKAHFSATDFVQTENVISLPGTQGFVQDEILIDSSIPENNRVVVPTDAPVVLIVEDNNDLRLFLYHKLSGQYNVEQAVDGQEGWEKAKAVNPDLIISDIMMPRMNGIELTNNLRNDFDTSHIPIILLSARSSVENMIEGIQYGADAYIVKPFSMDFLLARISGLLEQRRRLIEKYGSQPKVLELGPEEVVVTAKDEQFLKDVIRIVEENMTDPEFNVEKIAQAIGMGRTSFFKKLKGLTSMSPVEFLRDMRVKRGHQLLQTGDYTVSEAAYKIGFSDAGYFSKCFKEQFNITPTDFLKLIKSSK